MIIIRLGKEFHCSGICLVRLRELPSLFGGMEWTQRLETDDIELDELKSIIGSMETDGTLSYVNFELVSDEPINVRHSASSHDSTNGVDRSDVVSETDTGSDVESETAQGDSGGQADRSSTAGSGEPATKYTTESDSQAISASAHPRAKAKPQSMSDPEPQSQSQSRAKSEPDSDSLTVPAEVADVLEDAQSAPISVRKWPRMDRVLDSEHELPLAAAAYPAEVETFDGDGPDDVEHNTTYYARVNGRKDYGVFVTLNGSGFSPKSKYYEVTGLTHRSNILGRGPFNYAQGDEMVVELESNTDEGLAFRELPLLSTDNAKQARHSELLRLNNLGLEKGGEITFSKWPEEQERSGTVEDIHWGENEPIRPPTVEVEVESQTEGGSTTYEVRPSEIVARVKRGEMPTTATPTIRRAQVEDEDEDAQPDRGELQEAAGREQTTDNPVELLLPESSDSESNHAEPMTNERDEADDDLEDEDDETESDDDSLSCPCGRDDFENEHQLWGHQSQCDTYREQDGSDEEFSAQTETESESEERAELDDGEEQTQTQVVDPVLLNLRNEYAKVAGAMYLADEEEFRVRDIAALLADTDWEMGKTNIHTHLATLRDKGAATRWKDGVYHHSLTERGKAGVEQMFADQDSDSLPDIGEDTSAQLNEA